jgi:uncharacterized protein (UPF0335 family)
MKKRIDVHPDAEIVQADALDQIVQRLDRIAVALNQLAGDVPQIAREVSLLGASRD